MKIDNMNNNNEHLLEPNLFDAASMKSDQSFEL